MKHIKRRVHNPLPVSEIETEESQRALTLATFKTGTLCFHLLQLKNMWDFQLSTVSYTDQCFVEMRISIPGMIARSMLGLSNYQAVAMCKRIFVDQKFGFQEEKFIPLPNHQIGLLVKEMIGQRSIKPNEDKPYKEGLEQQSREPPMELPLCGMP